MLKSRASFTLIELLIVLAIVAILSVVVILTLNPAELLKQARDSNRLSDFSNINSALGVFNTDINSGFMGTSSVVYVSLADTTTTCANLGLPTLSTGWSYNCVTTANLKKADGAGWIPVNFKIISFGAPLTFLPLDPINTTSTGRYYTYAYNSGWQLTASPESAKYAPNILADGGTDPVVYEVGTNLKAAPFARSLWPNVGDFEIGTDGFVSYAGGTVTNGSANGSVINSNALLTTAAVAPTGGNYGGYNNSSFPTLTVGQKYTLSLYAKNISNSGSIIVSNQSGVGDNSCLAFTFTPTSQWQLFSKTCVLDAAKPSIYVYSSVANQQWVTDGLRVELAN